MEGKSNWSADKKNKEKIFEEYTIPNDFEDLSTDSQQANLGQVKKKFTQFLESSWWTGTVIVLVAITAFSLGRFSVLGENREPVRVIYDTDKLRTSDVDSSASNSGQAAAVAAGTSGNGSVVGSRNGAKYHYPWCVGAKQISSKNLITFNSIEEARAKGYTPAANCKGLK